MVKKKGHRHCAQWPFVWRLPATFGQGFSCQRPVGYFEKYHSRLPSRRKTERPDRDTSNSKDRILISIFFVSFGPEAGEKETTAENFLHVGRHSHKGAIEEGSQSRIKQDQQDRNAIVPIS